MSHLSPTDTALRNWAAFGSTGQTLSWWQLTMLRGDLGPMCAELIAMRAADPRTARRRAPDQVDDDTLHFWAMCFATNPDYVITLADRETLTLVVPAISAELLAYRLLITREKSLKGTRLRQALARRARRRGDHATGRAA